MQRNVEFLGVEEVGNVVLQNLEKQVVGRAYHVHNRSVNYSNSKLVLSYNPTNRKGSLGDCIVPPADFRWGAYEAGDGIVLMRFSYSVGWLFWGGTNWDGFSIKIITHLDNAIRYKQSQVKAVLAILNVDKKETSNG